MSMTQPICRVALVGCGQIADAHLQEIRKVRGARLVGVCDRHPELARQVAARFGVPAHYDDLGRMLAEARPDVLHVTTPPHTHRAVALQGFAAGAHVYVEKPFTPTTRDADDILAAARDRGRLVCVGHDQLFDPAWEECRRRHRRGEFGRVLHVESAQGYNLDGPFGQALVDDPDHWVHRLPGGLFQNVISHALYRITEFLPDEAPRVWATWFGALGPAGVPTELRVFLQGAEVTATLCFSAAVRPVQRVTRVYGDRGSVEVDLDARAVRRLRAPGLPGPFGKLDVPACQVREAAGTLLRNLRRLLGSDLHYFAGMNRLFGLFYRAALDGGPPPIPYPEIRRVTAIMDAIFDECRKTLDRSECRCGAELEFGAAGRGAA
jgi:predicted dehydrogenase